MACKACAEKDRHIETLKDQIEWYRTHVGTPTMRTVTPSAWQETELLHETEEEEDLRAMAASGAIDEVAAQEALTRALSNIDLG